MITYIILITYIIGCVVTFFFLDKKRNQYYQEHNIEPTREERKETDSMIITMTLFSWVAFILYFIGIRNEEN